MLTAVPANDLCTATALPRPGEPPVVPAAIKKAANVACTVATFLGPGCDHDAPMLYERPAAAPVQPCGGPPVPPCGGPPVPPTGGEEKSMMDASSSGK